MAKKTKTKAKPKKRSSWIARKSEGEPLWRDGADAEETARIEAIDEEKKKLIEKIAELSSERAKITNRCIQRARYTSKAKEEARA